MKKAHTSPQILRVGDVNSNLLLADIVPTDNIRLSSYSSNLTLTAYLVRRRRIAPMPRLFLEERRKGA
jgi:hypothetical protein